MLWVADKIFLGLVVLLSSPALVFVAVVLGDLKVFMILCMYALFSVRLVSSDCVFIKSVGYGAASAPLLLILEPK